MRHCTCSALQFVSQSRILQGPAAPMQSKVRQNGKYNDYFKLNKNVRTTYIKLLNKIREKFDK
jgi:hypothetical protein